MQFHTPDSLSIGFTVFAGLVPNRQTWYNEHEAFIHVTDSAIIP